MTMATKLQASFNGDESWTIALAEQATNGAIVSETSVASIKQTLKFNTAGCEVRRHARSVAMRILRTKRETNFLPFLIKVLQGWARSDRIQCMVLEPRSYNAGDTHFATTLS